MDSDLKTFSAQAVLLDMGHETELYDYSDATLFYDAPVPVVGESGRQVGWACIKNRGKEIIGDLKIDYHCPERLSIEAGNKVYALASIERYGEESKGKMAVEMVEVTSVALDSSVKSSDLHIPPVRRGYE